MAESDTTEDSVLLVSCRGRAATVKAETSTVTFRLGGPDTCVESTE